MPAEAVAPETKPHLQVRRQQDRVGARAVFVGAQHDRVAGSAGGDDAAQVVGSDQRQVARQDQYRAGAVPAQFRDPLACRPIEARTGRLPERAHPGGGGDGQDARGLADDGRVREAGEMRSRSDDAAQEELVETMPRLVGEHRPQPALAGLERLDRDEEPGKVRIAGVPRTGIFTFGRARRARFAAGASVAHPGDASRRDGVSAEANASVSRASLAWSGGSRISASVARTRIPNASIPGASPASPTSITSASAIPE